MGGYGSGKWIRTGNLITTEEAYGMDIRRMHEKGKLTPGNVFPWSWYYGRRRVFAVAVRVSPDADAVKVFRSSANGEVLKELVRLSWTRPHYGGALSWWLCPCCGKRVAILYARNGWEFACRQCHNLVYPVQRESDWDAALRKARKIRKRLGAGPSVLEPVPPKPLRMRWATYTRLREELLHAEKKAVEALKAEFVTMDESLIGMGLDW